MRRRSRNQERLPRRRRLPGRSAWQSCPEGQEAVIAALRGERAPWASRSRLAWLGVLAMLLGACAGGMGGGASNSSSAAHALVGAPAPAFELQEVASGRAQSL